VTVEKAVTHIIVKSMSSTPHRGIFIVSSSVSKYLKKIKKFSNSTIRIKTRILIQVFVITAPLYLLVVTYAVVKLFLHVTERFIRAFGLFVNIWLLYLTLQVLLRYDLYLSDIQEGQFELLQLTAGNAHHSSVQVCEAEMYPS
jgi:hypothetical protein